jgi:hypothetical protein
MTQRNLLIPILMMALMSRAVVRPSFAQKAAVPKQPDTVALSSEKAKELLLLMDTDKNGRISKQEWLKFMEAEFDRLDVERKGEIEPKELLQSTVSVGHVRPADLGK